MELAHLGEARAGSKCGRMDQCCALGTNHVAAMFFDGKDVKIYEVLIGFVSRVALFPGRSSWGAAADAFGAFNSSRVPRRRIDTIDGFNFLSSMIRCCGGHLSACILYPLGDCAIPNPWMCDI